MVGERAGHFMRGHLEEEVEVDPFMMDRMVHQGVDLDEESVVTEAEAS